MRAYLSSSSIFCSFLFLWFLTYPLSYVFIRYLGVELQQPITFGVNEINSALCISLFSLLLFIFFSRSIQSNFSLTERKRPENFYIVMSLIPIIGMCLHFLYEVELFSTGIRNFANSNSMRSNSTFYFFFVDLITPATIMFITLFEVKSKADRRVYLFFILFLLIISFLLGQVFYSRRYLALPVFALGVHFVVKKRLMKYLILLTICSCLFSPVLNHLRQLSVTDEKNEIVSDRARTRFDMNVKPLKNSFIQSLSSSYEGLNHLSEYFKKAGLGKIIWGHDYGVSNTFNLILSNVPRFMWPSKPQLTGSVDQQSFIYPKISQDPKSMSTFPPGYIVDFIFGFGFIGLVLFTAFFTFLFSTVDKVLSRGHVDMNYFLSIFAFINLFNFLRGGTSYIGNFLSPLFIALLLLGFERIKSLFLIKNLRKNKL